jgi:hypothetical protein
MNPAEQRQELGTLLPSPGDPVLPSGRHLQLRDHLMQEITREATGDFRVGARTEGRRRRRAALITMPLVTSAAVLAAVLAGGTGSGPDDPVTDQEAVGLLNRIATVAAAEDAMPVRDDQYVYTRVQGTQQIMDEGKDTFRRSDWQAVDGKRAGLARITVLSGPSGEGTRNMRLDADPNAVTYRELQTLPTDTNALYRKIWADTGGQGPTHAAAALEAIGALLNKATLLPQVDAALYRAAARIPGVSVAEHAEDAAGRRGIGLAFRHGDDRDVWVFDHTTLHYLGSDEVALLDVGVVDKIGEIPGE